MEFEEVKSKTDAILGDTTVKMVSVPLEDLVWTIVNFDDRANQAEDKLAGMNHEASFYNKEDVEKLHSLVVERECYRARIDELARVIGQYTDFDTSRIL